MTISIANPLSMLLTALFMFDASAGLARQTHVLERADGTQITFHVDRHAKAARQSALLLLQGSGCEPVAANTRVTSVAPVLAPEHAVITVEKYGVHSASARQNLVDGCSPDYWAGNTLDQRVIDAAQVVARLRQERWWNGNLVIFGGSEGGAVAAMLAPIVPETQAVLVFSSGIGVPVGELIRAAVPPPWRPKL